VRFLLRSLLPVITPIFRGLRSARYLLFFMDPPSGMKFLSLWLWCSNRFFLVSAPVRN